MMKWCSMAALLLALLPSQASKANNVSAKISGGSLFIYGDTGSPWMEVKDCIANRDDPWTI